MTTEDAYDTICEAIKDNRKIRLVNRFFDHENFGNFVVEYTNEAKERSIICDRGQILVCKDFSGSEDCRIIVSSVHDIEESELLEIMDWSF